MKIVQLCAIDQTMNIFLKELNRQLLRQNHEVICVCSKGPYTKQLKQEGYNVINIPISRKIRPLSIIRSIYKLFKLFKKEKPDVVHTHTPIASVLGRIAAKIAGVPITIYTAHGFYFHENMSYIKYMFFLCIEKYMAKYFADFIFTQSDEDRQTALKHNFINENKILNIGNGVDVENRFNPKNIKLEEISKLYKDLDLSNEDIVISFIGRMVKEKGILDLLEAFSGINNENVKLLIVGDIDQDCRDQDTKQLIRGKYTQNKNILFTGFRNDIQNILCITDIFCLPSYREGMPRTIIEAMSMECAVIATDLRGCREEVVEGETGFLVNINSPNQIKEKINILINDNEQLSKMKNEGRKIAVKYFNENDCVKKQIEVIENLYQTMF